MKDFFQVGQTVRSKVSPQKTATIIAVQGVDDRQALWVASKDPGCTRYETWFSCKVELAPEPEPPKPKPCPHCGQPAKTQFQVDSGGKPINRVYCSNHECYAMGPLCDTPEEAIAAWDSISIGSPESEEFSYVTLPTGQKVKLWSYIIRSAPLVKE